MNKLNKFAQLTKVDTTKRQVWGVATNEAPDNDGQVMDYASSKPHFEEWSSEIQKASGGKSKGNLRAMHQPIAAGKVIDIQFDDINKSIYIGAEVVDDNEWKKVQKGVYTGFSIGGKYGKVWIDGELERYEALPHEISLADLPCNPDATFEVIKAGGVSQIQKFKKETDMDEEDKKEEPVNGDGQTEQGEQDEHMDVMSALDDAIANGSEELKAFAARIKSAIESDETEEAKAEGTEGKQEAPAAPAEGEGMSGEAAPADSEAVRSEVLSVLEEVGLVEVDGEAVKVRLPKVSKIQSGDMEKVKSEMKRVSDDLVKVAASVADIEDKLEHIGSGPVLRELPITSPEAASKIQEAEVLRKTLEGVTNFTERQVLMNRITALEIAAAQKNPK